LALLLALVPSSRADRMREPFQASAVGQAVGDAVADLFRGADADLGGRIDRLELLKTAPADIGEQPNARENVEEVLSKLFGQADLDGDGSLDMREAEALVGLLHRSGDMQRQGEEQDEEEDVLAEMFRALDEEGDGKIRLGALLKAAVAEDQPGLAALVEKVFAMADADLDGSLDGLEVERFMELLDEHLAATPGADYREEDSQVDEADEVYEEGVHEEDEEPEEPEEDEADEEVEEVEGEDAKSTSEATHVATMFRRMDVDADREISLQEFLDVAGEEGATDRSLIDWAVKQFGTAHASADGRLDSQEARRLVELFDDAPEYGFFVDTSSSDDEVEDAA